MVEIKQMPYSEKHDKVVNSKELVESVTATFVQRHLGEEAVAQLRDVWRQGVKPMAVGASSEEKYESAYSNWVWVSKCALAFVRERMREEGTEQLRRAQVDALKQHNASPALLFLGLIRAVAPGAAFQMTARQMAYQLQWLTPYTLSELTGDRAVLNIPRCKVLDYPDTEELCTVACQGTYPIWVAEQFSLALRFDRQDKSCTITLARFA